MGRTFDDNRPLVAALLDSIQQAHASRAVVDGVAPTEGTGDWDVDIAAGTVRIDGSGDVAVSAQTVDLADPTSDLAAGEGRIVLVSVDDTGTASATEGAGASDPASPDVPADEVVVWVGFVTEADASLSTAETWDARTIVTGVPPGVITMWSGAISDIPEGWSLCDGTDGTPDLQDRFVTGAGDQYAVGDTGGEDEHQLTESELASHDHPVTDPGHSHPVPFDEDNDTVGTVLDTANDVPSDSTVPTNEATTGISVDNAGGDQPHENRPPFYALAYIQKV